MKKSVTRLYSQFKPKHYDLALKLFPDKKTFEGSVIISGVRLGRPSQRLTFHQKDLKVYDATVRRIDKKGDQIYTVDRINTHKSYDEVRLHTKEKLFPGEYVVMMHFKGKITDPMNGLYPCYFQIDGQEKMLLATQFESHHAREVFPCVDEPEAKATFSLTLGTPEKGTVIANTPVSFTAVNDGFRVTDFEKTPVMSTYLLAFVYGEIDYLEAKTKNGTAVRTYATPDKVKHTQFALDVAVRCLEFYEEYFDIPYPLPKSDMVALPDFASGAMENWGLITYREQALLFDPKNTSVHGKQWVAMVVAHELAHMWFGNLVTMRWWTDLWLNEGFASWIEYLAIDHIFPEWGMWTQFIADEQSVGLRLDGLEFTHPVEVPINHPDEIRTIFDAISYQKGSSVIHMLHDYLGAESFRDGLRHYLKRHAYGNTDTVDLWAALEEISGKPVKSFMHAWTSQPGYPIVHAEVSDKEVSLNQERFFINPMHGDSKQMHWPVPLLGSEEMTPDSFAHKDASATFTPSKTPLIINKGHRGFYRTVYDSKHVESLAELIPKFDPEDRLGILMDAFEAAKAGQGSTVDVLRLLPAYKAEQHASVWDIISSNIIEMRRVMDDESVRDLLKPYIQNLTKSELQRLGWEEKPNESYFDQLLRPSILGLVAGADEPSVVKEIEQRFSKMKKSEDIRPDIRSVIYSTMARRGDDKVYEKLLSLYDESDNAEEKITLAAALTNFEQPELYDRSLSFIKTKRVRLQDVAYWLSYSLANRFAKQATWQWVKDNWEWMEKNLGNDLSFYRTPVYVARSFSNPEFRIEYDTFFEPKSSPALERSIKQGQEMLDWQAAWKQRDLDQVKKFLRP